MRYGILVQITDGMDQRDMTEERCENLMDQRARWNVPFQWDYQEKNRTIAAESVTRLQSYAQIFTLKRMRHVRDMCRPYTRKKWWSNFVATLTRTPWPNYEQESIDDAAVWRLAGGAHFWKDNTGAYLEGDAVLFIEYDANIQHGYGLIVCETEYDTATMRRQFNSASREFSISEKDFQLLCNRW